MLGPYAALAAHGHAPLDPTRLFTIVTTINLMSAPLTLLGLSSFFFAWAVDLICCLSFFLSPTGTGLPQLRAAWASVLRIEKYLLMEERDPAQPALNTNTALTNSPSWEKIDDAPPSSDITLESASFSWAADKPAFLGPLSVALTPGHLHLCVGPVASVGHSFFSLGVVG